MAVSNLIARLYRRLVPQKIPTHPFDLRHGVDTSGLLYADKLATGHPHDGHNTAYWGTHPSLLNGALDHWQATLAATPHTVSDYTLIDIGAGKGRVVMLASARPFLRIVGVELSPALTAIAAQNLTTWLKTPYACTDITVLHADALALPLPATPTLIYLFNPFDAHLMQLLLDHILATSRTTPIDFIYTRHEHADLFDRIPRMTLLWEGEIPLAAEDRAADAFSTQTQNTRIYRLLPPTQLA